MAPKTRFVGFLFQRESPESAQHCCCGKQFNLSVSPSQPLLSTQSAQPVRPLEKQPQGLSPRVYKAASSGPGAAPLEPVYTNTAPTTGTKGLGSGRHSHVCRGHRAATGASKAAERKGTGPLCPGRGTTPSSPRSPARDRFRAGAWRRSAGEVAEGPRTQPHSVYLPRPLYRYSVVPSLRGRPGLGLRNRLSRALGI